MKEHEILALRDDGFCLVRGALSSAECDVVLDELGDILSAGESGSQGFSAHFARNLLSQSSMIQKRVSRPPFISLAREVLGIDAVPVKGIYFDKNPGSNWVVPWHQDLTIALQERHEVDGYSNWTVKEGAWHVQPPVSVLESQVTLRLHLDDCSEQNGALRVVPGSHRLGRLHHTAEAELREEVGEVLCEARRGDVLVMSPLILHASSKAVQPSHRRIVHIEYSAARLQEPLAWRD
ncbi:MAG: phytanoyl-CoA dioxygenase family protein [bacterium]|nr:phytanoyl-CoA dioxygenase family protein [bacterium]